MKFALCALLATSLLSACGWVVESELATNPPEGLDVAWWHEDCAPWDGPAVTIYLGTRVPDKALDPTYPHLRISIFDSPMRLSGESYHWDKASDLGDVQFCSARGTCQRATGVTVEFDETSAGGHYRGRVGARFPDGSYRRGSFDATRIEFRALCG